MEKDPLRQLRYLAKVQDCMDSLNNNHEELKVIHRAFIEGVYNERDYVNRTFDVLENIEANTLKIKTLLPK